MRMSRGARARLDEVRRDSGAVHNQLIEDLLNGETDRRDSGAGVVHGSPPCRFMRARSGQMQSSLSESPVELRSATGPPSIFQILRQSGFTT